MSDKHPNEDVPIEVLKSASGKDYSAADCGTIRQLVREKLLLTSTKPYHSARVEVQPLTRPLPGRATKGIPAHVVSPPPREARCHAAPL